MKYVAMWNMPGCLPEMEPAGFDTFKEARDYIVDALESVADDMLCSSLSTNEPTREDTEYWRIFRAVSWSRKQTAPFAMHNIEGYTYSVEQVQP